MTRSASVVVNGRAGALLDAAHDPDGMRRMFVDAGIEPAFVPAEMGSLPERVEAARRSGTDLVVVAGGDGTVACAAGVLAGTGSVLGILPFGTMNLLAKDLGIPVGDVPAAVRLLAEGDARAIDVAEVNGQIFLCASMLGLPARLGRFREAERTSRLGWLRFGWAALRATRRYVSPSMSLTVDGAASALRTPSLTITVNALDDRSGRLFGRSRLDAGVLASYAVERPHWRLLPSLLSGLLRGRPGAEIVTERVGSTIVVELRRAGVPVMNDGERSVLRPPLRYASRPGALRVIGGDAR